MEKPGLLWIDGMPTLFWRGSQYRLDRYWVSRHRRWKLRYDQREIETLVPGLTVLDREEEDHWSIATMDGPVLVEDEKEGELLHRVLTRGRLCYPVLHQDGRPEYTSAGLVAHGLSLPSDPSFDYLVLRSWCKLDRMPDVGVLDVSPIHCDSKVREINVIYCAHISGWNRLVHAPVVISNRRDSGYSHVHARVLALSDMYYRTVEELSRLHRDSLAEWVLIRKSRWHTTSDIYHRGPEQYELWDSNRVIPIDPLDPDSVGVSLGEGYPVCHYEHPPRLWIGVRPPPTDGYLVHLVTPLVTVWKRVNHVKSARSAA